MSWRARLSTNLQEMRFHFCPVSAGSTGLRAFLEDNFYVVRKLNPRFPFLVREGDGAKAQVIARYDWNEQRNVDLDCLTVKEIELKIQSLVELGETMDRSPESVPKDRDLVDEIDVRTQDDY